MIKKRKYEPCGFKLDIKRSAAGAGLGLFAGEPIAKGDCIIEYTGRVISAAEECSSRSKYLFGISSKKTIDGSSRSNTARYINHCCRPNAEAEIKKGRVLIMARKNIKPGDEIRYDYGKEYWNEHIKPIGCRCLKRCCSSGKKA